MRGLPVGVFELSECRAHGRLVSECGAMASGIFLPLHRHPYNLAPSPADLRAVPELCAVFAPFGGAGGFHGAFVFKRGGGGGAEVRPAGVALDAALQTSFSLDNQPQTPNPTRYTRTTPQPKSTSSAVSVRRTTMSGARR